MSFVCQPTDWAKGDMFWHSGSDWAGAELRDMRGPECWGRERRDSLSEVNLLPVKRAQMMANKKQE